MLKMAKKTFTERIGMNRGRKRDADGDFDHFNELSRCNSYDFDPMGLKESDTVYFRERHLVAIEEIQVGMGRFAFLLETCSPGSVPDPLLIAGLLDLVRKRTKTLFTLLAAAARPRKVSRPPPPQLLLSHC
jgi:hypothetical protein